jgi:hypothetical protein
VKAKRLPPGAGEDDDLDDDSEEEDDRDEAKKTTKTSKISKNLSDLVNIISAVHFHGFDQGEWIFRLVGHFWASVLNPDLIGSGTFWPLSKVGWGSGMNHTGFTSDSE